MRSDKELLRVVIDNFKYFFDTSICYTLDNLCMAEMISPPERFRVLSIIEKYKPEKTYDFYFYFPKYDHISRIKFLSEILENYDDSMCLSNTIGVREELLTGSKNG